ncbi:MAG TPA: nodulation protein NfeD [Thermoanaerobaculia bacterium]|nr:nodulation protein NfeD [Thermoanaerobaculia bacterium]
MRFPRALFLVSLTLLAIPQSATSSVLKIVVDDMIHPATEEFISRSLADAAEHNDKAVLIELRTPGGLESSTRKIVERIVSSPVPVIVFVTPGGSRAASAGFIILESADVAAMSPGTNTGAAHPVTIGGEKIDEIMKQKMENDTAAWMRSIATKRKRNVEVAESAVRQSRSFTEQEALSQKLIDLIATSDVDLLGKLDGRIITRFDGRTTLLHTKGEAIRSRVMTLKERILSFIMDPNVAFLLFALGVLGLSMEFSHPGSVLPGVVGVIALVLAIVALNILPTRFAALGLILLAFMFFALEAKFTSHGVLAIGGVVSMILGALFLVDGPIPEMRVQLWSAAGVSIPFGLIAVFLMTLALRTRRQPVITGGEGLIGEVGVARTAIGVDGKIFVHGTLWNAISNGEIAAGSAVRVRRVNGLTLEVEAV